MTILEHINREMENLGFVYNNFSFVRSSYSFLYEAIFFFFFTFISSSVIYSGKRDLLIPFSLILCLFNSSRCLLCELLQAAELTS